MKYTSKREKNTLTVAFKVTTEEWNSFDQKAYEQNKGKYNVPGFRKGHVPKNVLENRYGKGLFFEDALYLAAQEYYNQYLDKNKKVEPVARPALDEKTIKVDEKGVSFSIVVDVYPEFELGQYKGIEIKKTAPAKVKVADVDAEIEIVRQRNARFVEVTDRPVQDGDTVNLNYCGKVDGVAFQGGTAENQDLTIGSHTFIEGFEPQLIGMNIGETKDITVTFPAEYHAEELKGKEAVFTCTINKITVKELPAVDDDFAKDVSEFSTLKEYKADVKKTLTERNEKDAAAKDEDKLFETIVENTKVDIPQSMIEEQIDQYVEDFKYQLMYQGLNLDDYLKYTSSSMEDLRKQYADRAQKAVHTRIVFDAIVKAEKLTATDEETQAKIAAYAERVNKPVDEFKKELRESDLVYFQNQAISEKLMNMLKSENKIG